MDTKLEEISTIVFGTKSYLLFEFSHEGKLQEVCVSFELLDSIHTAFEDGKNYGYFLFNKDIVGLLLYANQAPNSEFCYIGNCVFRTPWRCVKLNSIQSH